MASVKKSMEPLLPKETLSDHYKDLAPSYDKYNEVFSRACADFMKTFMSLTSDDQIVDIGGGTAQISFMLHKEFKLKKPVVCIDPSKEMLTVAEKNGAITVESSAESFLSTEPKFPLKMVIMTGCAHHFERPDYVFSQLASFMPDDGLCLVTMIAQPVFPHSIHKESTNRLKDIYEMIDFGAIGLKCRMIETNTQCKIEKELWYCAIRDRVNSFLSSFSEEELESVIEKWEEAMKDECVISFESSITTLIITKAESRQQQRS